MTLKVKVGDEVVVLPDCFCPTRDGIRVQSPKCPQHGEGGKWRVVAVPADRLKPGG